MISIILSFLDSVNFSMVDGAIDAATVLIAHHNSSFKVNCIPPA